MIRPNKKGSAMYKPARIGAFVVVCLAILLAPLLINHAQAPQPMTSALATPQIEALDQHRCIESTEYMRADHMKLLDDWRNEVLRGTATMYQSSTGQIYDMSLEETCFSCHSNRAEFCLSCHDVVAVSTDCWNCHDGQGGEVSS